MLYLNIPIVFGLLIYSLTKIASHEFLSIEFLGSLLSLGLVIVSNGINVAHELCHRTKTFERFLGKFLLIPSLYMHFYLEHNYGHHLKVDFLKRPVIWLTECHFQDLVQDPQTIARALILKRVFLQACNT